MCANGREMPNEEPLIGDETGSIPPIESSADAEVQ
jgi:hypothetical protein